MSSPDDPSEYVVDLAPDSAIPFAARHVMQRALWEKCIRPKINEWTTWTDAIILAETAADALMQAGFEVRPIVQERLENTMNSVLQDWVMELPLREQGTLLTCVRGCDLEPKQWSSTGFADSPGRRITAWIRWCFMNPADPREVDIPGAFFQSVPPGRKEKFRPSEFGHLPLHWYTHIMHSLEVISVRHPDHGVANEAAILYEAMVHGLHLNVETPGQMIERLSEDRIAKGEVVS